MNICVSLNHFAAQQKLTRHCKSTRLQLKTTITAATSGGSLCARHGASHAVSFPEFISAAASLGDVGPVEKTGSLERGGTD